MRSRNSVWSNSVLPSRRRRRGVNKFSRERFYNSPMIPSPHKYTIGIVAVLCVTVCCTSARGNSPDDSSHHPTTGSVVLASLIPTTAFSATLVLNYVAFWKYAGTSPEHWSNDPPYAMHVDKLAHAYFSWFGSDMIQRGYIGAGLDTMESAWLGAGLTLLV